MSAYFIAQLNIHDKEVFGQYIDAATPVFGRYKGKHLAVEDAPEILEGKWDYTRLVLIEFPDKESLKEWYHSEDYQATLKLRFAAANADIIIV